MGANSLSPLCPLTAASGWNSEAAATGLEKASLLSMKVLRGRRGGLARAGGGLGYSVASRVPAVGPPAGSAGWAMGNRVCGKSREGALRQGRAY